MFLGKFDEDLEIIVEIYSIIAETFDATEV